MAATKAAVEEGIVVGGGVALIRTIPVLDEIRARGEEKVGIDILRKALEDPLRQIASNVGKDASVVVNEVKKHKGNYGYNGAKDIFEDLVEAGVVDPTKVTRSALQNAASIASLILTTEAVVTDLPEKGDKKMPGMPASMPGGMGY